MIYLAVAQDTYAYQSHRKAIAAIDAGRFKEEIVPLTIEETHFDSKNTSETTCAVFDTDEGPRRDTTPEALASLKPVFHVDGHRNRWQCFPNE